MHVLAAASTGLALLGARFNKTVIFFSFFKKKSLLLRLVLGAKTIAVKTHIATPVIRNMGPDGVMGPK
jgi:hypothetical protein